MRLPFLYSLIFFTFISCGPSRFVRTLHKKQHAVSISLGGPLFKYGEATIPMPFVSAGYGYGIDSTLTVFSAINITSGLYKNVQLELGLTKRLLKQHRYIPALSTCVGGNFIYHDQNAKKFYPQLDLNAYWEYGKRKSYLYLGVDNWFELSAQKEYGYKQTNHWFMTPIIGHVYAFGKWEFLSEIKIIAPNLSNENLVIEYQTPFQKHGAFGLYLGLIKKIK